MCRTLNFPSGQHFFILYFVVVVLLYEKFVLVARPNLNCSLGVWRPYASVLGAYYGSALYHQFNELERTFLTEEEAEAFCFAVARAWVDEHSRIGS